MLLAYDYNGYDQRTGLTVQRVFAARVAVSIAAPTPTPVAVDGALA